MNSTAHKILDVAEQYTQTNGFNAFSYKDVQNDVGVKTSTIHYYFATKQDLALAMTERYAEQFEAKLNEIASSETDGIKRLEKLGQVYVKVVGQDKFCMCGMLASDALTLPDNVNKSVDRFFTMLEQWIEEALNLSQTQNQIRSDLDSKSTSAQYLSLLEGGMLVARVRKDPSYLKRVLSDFLSSLKA